MTSRKKHKIKIVIMQPKYRRGAWLYGVNKKGLSVVVPVSCVGKVKKDLPRGFREYRL